MSCSECLKTSFGDVDWDCEQVWGW